MSREMKALDTMLLEVLEAAPRVAGARIGAIVGLRGGPIVDFPGNPLGPQPARVVAALTADTLAAAVDARLPVLLVFEDDDPGRPVIVDVVIDHPLRPETSDAWTSTSMAPAMLVAAPVGIASAPSRLASIVRVEEAGVIVRVDDDGTCLEAKTAVRLRNLKDPVVIVHLHDGSTIIVGQLYDGVQIEAGGGRGADVVLRGRTIRIEAEVELVLASGACSLHLDARGKVLTRADQIVSRARGANKVQGGSVHLN